MITETLSGRLMHNVVFSAFLITCLSFIVLISKAQAGQVYPSNRISTEYTLHHREKPFVLYGKYINPASATFKNEAGIIGLDMVIQDNAYPVIEHVYPGTPAFLKGIQPGETLLRVDGVLTFGKSLPAIDELISNIPGTTVQLSLLNRQGNTRKVILTVIPLSALPDDLKSPFSSFISE